MKLKPRTVSETAARIVHRQQIIANLREMQAPQILIDQELRTLRGLEFSLKQKIKFVHACMGIKLSE